MSDFVREPNLDVTADDVAEMSSSEREQRVVRLVRESARILSEAEKVLVGERELRGRVALFSGGRDSTVLFHVMRPFVTHAAHANTGIGIEQTRVFVRDVCRAWDVPLIEKHPPAGSTYREQVLSMGFPGPAQHYRMYQRLKERALRQVRSELVDAPRSQRVVFLAGRRRDESKRRAHVPLWESEGSIAWVSPLALWTTPDLMTYRRMNPDLPVNEVSDMLHMSGECLCGAFAAPGELDEIGMWFPQVRADIEKLQDDAAAAGVSGQRCRWGWGAYRREERAAAAKSGRLCSSCDAKFAS